MKTEIAVAEGKSIIFISIHTTKKVPTGKKSLFFPEDKQPAFLQTIQSEK